MTQPLRASLLTYLQRRQAESPADVAEHQHTRHDAPVDRVTEFNIVGLRKAAGRQAAQAQEEARAELFMRRPRRFTDAPPFQDEDAQDATI